MCGGLTVKVGPCNRERLCDCRTGISLPVVQEDIRDYTDSNCLTGDEIYPAAVDQANLQESLDICLSNLENLQFPEDKEHTLQKSREPVQIYPASLDRCPPQQQPVVDYLPSKLNSTTTTTTSVVTDPGLPETAEKSDSGFWSQSFDTYRVSMAALEDSGEDSLDAILLSLNALGDELDQETRRVSTISCGIVPATTLSSRQQSVSSSHSHLAKPAPPYKPNFDGMPAVAPATGKSVSPLGVAEFDLVEHYYKQAGIAAATAESPDNDSAFSDNVSCISSESGASRLDGGSCMSSGSSSKSSNGSLNAPSPTQATSTTAADSAARGAVNAKTEKLKLVHEKIDEGDGKKLLVKMHYNDDCVKRFLIDERMDCLDVCQISAEKVATKMHPDCAIVEYLPELNIERIFEDHEKPMEEVLMWGDELGGNKLLYVERKDKYHFIARPEIYLAGFACRDSDYDELARRTLVQEYFSSCKISPPELEGSLYLRIEAKKAWKKCWFVLRASGLYYSTKSKSKSSADLECLTSFDVVNLHRGINWRKKLKAPSDFGFALKLPQIQSAKANKNVKYVCTDDQNTLDIWMAGIRIAKYGRTLYDNFNRALERAATQDITYESDCVSAQQTPVASRRLAAPTNDSTAFDDDLTTGTIKRKPAHSTASATPKLPFTSKTSHILMRSADERRSFASSQSSRSSQSSVSEVISEPELPPPPPDLLVVDIAPTPLSPLIHRNGGYGEPVSQSARSVNRVHFVEPLGSVGMRNGYHTDESATILRNGPYNHLVESSAVFRHGEPSSPVMRNGPLSPVVSRGPIPRGGSMPLSPPPGLRSPPPPTPPKPAALQRKPNLTDQHRHSIGPTPTSPLHGNNHSAQVSNLPFLHELKNKSQSPLVTKKTLTCVPESHDVLSQPSSPARSIPVNGPMSPVKTAATNGYHRNQSMSPTPVGRLPPAPPRRSNETKLGSESRSGDGQYPPPAATVVSRRSEGFHLERSSSETNQPSQRVVASSMNFMADLTRVLAQKKRHSLLLNDAVDGNDYLPPPPPELLKATSPVPQSGEDATVRKKPPPPPKRSDGTYLSRVDK